MKILFSLRFMKALCFSDSHNEEEETNVKKSKKKLIKKEKLPC